MPFIEWRWTVNCRSVQPLSIPGSDEFVAAWIPDEFVGDWIPGFRDEFVGVSCICLVFV
jgi:hypothetical protein